MKNKKIVSFWVLISAAIVLILFLTAGQTFSLINYNLAIDLGLQESENEIGKVGIAFAKGFAFGDTIFYIPMLVLGILGLIKGKKWGAFFMFGGLAISVYWPIVHLYTIYIETDAIVLNPDKYISFPIILSLITIYGLWGISYLYKNFT
ncbi:hypothetical protein N9896_03030 [bacterium]|nr:hypothetical protein [bacterium]